MKNDIDAKHLLRVFDKIQQHGKQKDGARFLEGVKGFTDFDGYTVFLEDASVKLSFGFHNTYHLDYESNSQKEAFEKKLDYIDKTY